MCVFVCVCVERERERVKGSRREKEGERVSKDSACISASAYICNDILNLLKKLKTSDHN